MSLETVGQISFWIGFAVWVWASLMCRKAYKRWRAAARAHEEMLLRLIEEQARQDERGW